MSTKTVPALLAFALMSIPLSAQESRGAISGRVVDPSGAVIAGAEGIVDRPLQGGSRAAVRIEPGPAMADLAFLPLDLKL